MIPVQSYFVTKEELSSWQGIKIPMSGMSVLLAYLRGLSILLTFMAFMSIGILEPGTAGLIVYGICAAASVGLVALTMSARRTASETRSKEICQMLGVDFQTFAQTAGTSDDMYQAEDLPDRSYLTTLDTSSIQAAQSYIDLPPIPPSQNDSVDK